MFSGSCKGHPEGYAVGPADFDDIVRALRGDGRRGCHKGRDRKRHGPHKRNRFRLPR